jgi:hypothetical protein
LYISRKLVCDINFKSFKLLKYSALIKEDSNNFSRLLKKLKILKNFDIDNNSAAKKGIDLRDKNKPERQLITLNTENIVRLA